MKIRVVLERRGRIIAEPDPVRVLVGEPIEWEFVTDISNEPRIAWTVYFQAGSPFRGLPRSLAADSIQLRRPQPAGRILQATHVATTTPTVAAQPGDYKYSVRATSTLFGSVLADDDPHLLVYL